MKKFFLLFIFLPFFSLAEEKKMVIIGDSLTEGYGVSKESSFTSILQAKVKEAEKSWMIVNSGISGSTSASAVSRVKWILKSKPSLVILALGSNDALRGLKVTETKKNIESAIEAIQKEKILVVLAGLKAPPNYGSQYTKDFSQIFISLSKKHQIRLIPFLLEGVAGYKNLNLADGIHPNEQGHQIIAENIFESIKDLL